jgi:hypothetical protein
MKVEMQNDPRQVARKGERGAALLSVLLMSILVLCAGMALVATTSLSTATSVDSTAEMQAYSGAEAGLEATLHVLRGHVAPDASLPNGTKINFRTAALPRLSNKTSDAWATGTSATARLSGWLNYSYQNAANDWRVPLTASYAPRTGIAYRIEISDPDDPGPIAARRITTDATYVPTRLLIRSEGFGPKGAIKRLEMVVTNAAPDIKVPGAVTLTGSPINFDLGDSATTETTGVDMGTPPEPDKSAIAVASGNEATAQTVIDGLQNPSQVGGNPTATITAANSATFLQSADAARTFLREMRAIAENAGRLFSNKAGADAAGGLGTVALPKFTFIDNYSSGTPVSLGPNHQGSGLLIVTGNLEMQGSTDFEGVILVMGTGNVLKSGAGNGVIRGSIIVANFDPIGAVGTPFGGPTYIVDGGGNSTVGYDSEWIRKAIATLGLSILGIREYH